MGAVSLRARLSRPEYVFRPSAAVRRLRLGRRGDDSTAITRDVVLPRSQTITVLSDELGHSVRVSGIFDACATETIYRLLDPGDLAVDVGANVGYMTNLMATRVGPGGTVIAFEPHPLVFGILEANAARWDADERIAAVEARRLALSSEPGTGRLGVQPDFERHTGLASLRAGSEEGGARDVEVELATLDDLLAGRDPRLVKIDVEGHEPAVLQGAARLLAERRIRDVVFEDHATYPTEAMTVLESQGMTVLTLDHSLLGLRVHPVIEGPAPPGWPGPNYLATLDPDRAMARLAPRGWRSLRRR